MLVPWTPLAPSRRERVVRRIARTAAFATALALSGAAAVEPAEPALALAALAAASAAVLAGRARRRVPIEVGVDHSGSIVARQAGAPDDMTEQRLQCVFATPWLITLKRGTMCIPIWPDSVPGNTYRRFWVHIRWSSGRQPARSPAGPAPGQPK